MSPTWHWEPHHKVQANNRGYGQRPRHLVRQNPGPHPSNLMGKLTAVRPHSRGFRKTKKAQRIHVPSCCDVVCCTVVYGKIRQAAQPVRCAVDALPAAEARALEASDCHRTVDRMLATATYPAPSAKVSPIVSMSKGTNVQCLDPSQGRPHPHTHRVSSVCM